VDAPEGRLDAHPAAAQLVLETVRNNAHGKGA
jgi:hypothetical protein